ncbi:MAG: tripartite tricarboxylate transporter TctB family protein [Deltaproteobacteria bacterium]|nr:tripartite tricarboxylate transporter TctB family protein [Deltaproteobacteria bacterium]
MKICCSLFWLLFSVVMSREAFRLPMGVMRDPGAGFFPLLIALVTGLLAVIALVQALRTKREQGDGPRVSSPEEPFRWWNLVIIVAALAAYALTLETIGFLIDTFLFMFLLVKVIEPQSWAKSLIAALITAVASELFFNVLLQAQIPQGTLGF